MSAAWLGLWPWYRLGFNTSGSLPGFVYLTRIVDKAYELKVGQKVLFSPPTNPAYPEGFKFVKIVKGVPGDTVKFKGNRFYINEEYLGEANAASQSGRKLERGTEGLIPHNNYFVWTPHKNSYDSRYAEIGLISRDRVLGISYRIF